MATKSPLSIVKERFQDKDGLLKAVRELTTDDLWIDRVEAGKGLDAVSNKKLLRLHTILSDVKSGCRSVATKFSTTLPKGPRSVAEVPGTEVMRSTTLVSRQLLRRN